MKRLIIFILSLVALVSCDNTIRFLDIPIDGSRNMMIKKLEEKGFTYDYENNLMRGTFNGEPSSISISTSNGRVNRISVLSKAYDVLRVKQAYNRLLLQFKSNPKYIALENYNLIPVEIRDMYSGLKPGKHWTVFYRRKEFKDSYSINPNKAEGVVWFQIIEKNEDFFIELNYENLKKYTINSDL